MSDDDRFLDFITHQLDLSGLDERRRLTDDELERTVMPLIRGDIHAETLKIVAALLRSPQPDSPGDYWRQQLAPIHREIRQSLAQTVAALMEHRYPDRLTADEWLDAASFIITMAWLVRKHMDGDDPLPDGN